MAEKKREEMSRYEALRESDNEEDQEQEQEEEIKKKDMVEGHDMRKKIMEKSRNETGSDDSDVEEIIIPSSRDKAQHFGNTSIEDGKVPKQSGGLIVERIDKLTSSLEQVTPSDGEIQTCLKVLKFIGLSVSLSILNTFNIQGRMYLY